MNKFAFVFLFFTAPAFAQAWKDAPVVGSQMVYACQFVESGGLDWENGRWNLTGFNKGSPFFLSANNGSIVPESTKIALNSPFPEIYCHPKFVGSVQTCSDGAGGSLVFSFLSLKGAVGRIFGGISSAESQKDSLVVSPFVCTKM